MPPARRLLRVARLLRPLAVAAVVVGILTPALPAHAEPSIDEIQQRIDAKSSALEKVVEQYNKVNEKLAQSQAQAAAIEAKIKPLTSQMAEANARVTANAVRAFRGGDLAVITSLLTSGSPEIMVDRLTTIDMIARSQQRDLDSFTAAKQTHKVQAQALAALVATQRAQRNQLAAQRAKINKELAVLTAMRQEASSRVLPSTSSYSSVPPAVSGKAGVAVRYAYAALGKAYVWGAAGPNGYDCSGLTMAAWRAAGRSLPHNAEQQYYGLPHVGRGALQPGDLVFYEGLGHVAIYVGKNQVIHSPTFGEVVKVASIDVMPPYGFARVS